MNTDTNRQQTTRTIQIYDTTLRDGTQGEGISFSLQDKLHIAQRLEEIGFDFIEGGYPLSNAKDAEFFQQIRKFNLGNSQVCAFGMTRRRGMKVQDDPGMKALVAAGTSVFTIVGKTWDFHVTKILHVSLEENLAMIGESIEFLARHGRVIYDAEHFFDGWKANPEYAAKTMHAAASAGAIHLTLCDTNGGTMPEEIAAIVAQARQAVADFDVTIGIHSHNDCELAVANSLAAVDAGAVQVQGTINGLGERCGNADLISVIANLALKKHGYKVLGGRTLESLTELSRYVYETANLHLRNNQPFVGQSAFAHKGGMHVHAVNIGQQLRAHRSGTGRQRAADPGQRAIGPLEHRCPHRQAQSGRKPPTDGRDPRRSRRPGKPRLPVRSGRSVVRSVGPASGRHVPAALRQPPSTAWSPAIAMPRDTTSYRSDRQAAGRRATVPRSGRRRRPGECPGRRAAKSARTGLSFALGHAAGRLQGPRRQLRSRHRGVDPRDHREHRRATNLGHGRRQRKRHRGQLERTGRCIEYKLYKDGAKQAKGNQPMSTEGSADQAMGNRFDFATAAEQIIARWDEARLLPRRPSTRTRKPFTIVIPPPNVTGALHLGHALNNTLQDILIRMKRMQGFNTLWMPGTDHAGIATQAVVERRLFEEEKKTRHDLGRERLVERIWEWKEQYEKRILGQLKQMGCSCDWERTRFTLDEQLRRGRARRRSSTCSRAA